MWLLFLALTSWLINTTWKSVEYNNIGSQALIIAVNPSPHTSESDQVSPFFFRPFFTCYCVHWFAEKPELGKSNLLKAELG